MIECHLTERLTQRGCPQIGLEPIGIEHGDEGFDCVERRTGFGDVTSDVTTTTGEDGIDGGDAVGWSLDFDVIHGFQETRSGLNDDEPVVLTNLHRDELTRRKEE